MCRLWLWLHVPERLQITTPTLFSDAALPCRMDTTVLEAAERINDPQTPEWYRRILRATITEGDE